jgi:hypothetical protein
MTAREAIEKGIRLVRLPYWSEPTYLELPKRLPDGTHGPWAMLYDPISTLVLRDGGDKAEFPLPLLFTEWDDNDDRLVEFTGQRFTPEDIAANRHIQR